MDRQPNRVAYEGGLNLTDKDTFSEWIRLYEKPMYALAFSVVQNEADAGEVISESIYRAYRKIGTLKNERAFKPWILRIVHNTAVEMIRKNSKMLPTEEIRCTAETGNEPDLTTKLALRDAVERLNQPYRTVVVLFYYESLSIPRIAQITGSNIVAVKKQLSRARKMLREALKEDFDR